MGKTLIVMPRYPRYKGVVKGAGVSQEGSHDLMDGEDRLAVRRTDGEASGSPDAPGLPAPEPGLTRRRFLRNVIAGVSGAIAAAVGAPVVGYFFSPERRTKRSIAIPITRVSDIPIGRPTFVRYEQRVTDAWIVSTESKGAWVLTLDGKHFTVYNPHCTHLGCPYYWDQRRQIFQCPCHGGEYSIDGEVIAGPPPRPLDRLAYRIEGGEIVLTGSVIRGETTLP